jgi:uncharacterized protein YciI
MKGTSRHLAAGTCLLEGMYIVDMRYTAPLARVDEVLDGHREHVNRHTATGEFLVVGRKEPRVGGVIVATTESRARLDEILAQDPFQEVATFTVTEFLAAGTAPGLPELLSAADREVTD